MFVVKNQLYIFLACLSFGAISGLLFSLSALIKCKIKNKIIRIFPDALVFFITTISYIIYSYFMEFPNLRIYMIFAVFLGLYLYMKSFDIILAKVVKKIYNIFTKRKTKGKVNDDGIKV